MKIRTRNISGFKVEGKQAWRVFDLEGARLGCVAWFPRWKKYCFHPQAGAIYDHQHLREIAKFCADKTKELN